MPALRQSRFRLRCDGHESHPDREEQYASEVTTLAFVWHLRRRDGRVLGLTTCDQALEIDGVVYHPGGFDPTAMRAMADTAVDNGDVEGILDPTGELITEADMLAGLWDKTTVRLSQVDYTRPSAGSRTLIYGPTGSVNIAGGKFKAELRGLGQHLAQNMGIVVTETCRHQLGDARCGVDLAPFTIEGTVTSADSQDVFGDEDRTEPDAIYTRGTLTWLTGKNKGAAVEVRSCADGVVALTEAMPNLPAAGDTYSIVMGCNKLRRGDCKNKFDNTINHGGFSDLPGRDKLSSPEIAQVSA